MKFKKEILLLGIIGLVYFAVRLPHLTLQPIFADEAIYIRWAQVMRADPSLRFISLTDGKTPLYMWILIPLFKFIKDPLLAARFLSVLSGFLTLAGVYLLGRKFFNKRTALVAAALVAIAPFMVFFDRLALVDSMLTAFSVWALFLGLLLIKYERLDISMFLGYALGAGLLTKPPGFWSIFLLPTTLVTFDWKSKVRQNKMLKLFGLWIVALVITGAMYGVLKLGPGSAAVASRDQDYINSPLTLITSPLNPSVPHLHMSLEWGMSYLGPIILLAILGGVILVIKQKSRVGWSVILWIMIPLVLQAALIKAFTSRYILFSIPPLLLLAAYFIDWLLDKRVKSALSQVILFLLIVIWPVFFISQLLTNPAKVPLIGEERTGYLEEWTAGYGLKDIADYLRAEGAKSDVVVGTEGSFGTLPDGLQIYLDGDLHVAIIAGQEVIPAHLYDIAREHPTYFVSNRQKDFTYPENTQVVKIFPKPNSTNKATQAIILFRVLPLATSSAGLKK